MDDITLRALKTLREADAIVAEDTRTYRKLSTRHGIPNKPVYSLYKGNESARVENLLPKLQEGLNAALVSESGTPAVSDPGALLVRRCLESAVPVIPIPGPSSLTAILSVAGIFSDRVTFFGFLSKKKSIKQIVETVESGGAAVFFENPRRLVPTLEQLSSALPEARLVIGRELTKRFEEIWSGRLDAGVAAFEKRNLKGEIAVVIEPGSSSGRKSDAVPDFREARTALSKLREANISLSTAVRQVARELSLSRRALYAEALKLYSETGERA